MKKRIVSCSLIATQVLSAFTPIIANAYSLLTYYGPNSGMHFTPESSIDAPTVKGFNNVYLHLFKGPKPDGHFLKYVEKTSKEINKDLGIMVLHSDAKYQQGQHRVLLGPIKVEDIAKYGNAFKSKQIENFPVYFIDESLYLMQPGFLTKAKKEEAKPILANDPIYLPSTSNNAVRHPNNSEVALTRLNNEKQAAAVEKKTIITQSIANTPPLKQELATLAKELAQNNTTNQDIDELLLTQASQYIEQQTNAYVKRYASDWLSQYGTAKIDINLDNRFKFKSGEVDILLPFRQRTDGAHSSLWFIQPGAVFNDSDYYNGRDFAHIGLGYRKKTAKSLYGINTFYDHDLDYGHQRASIGLEYARRYFSLSGNYYFPLSGWKDDKVNYANVYSALESRAAEGVDLSFSGYLPQLPWVSFDASYEQYFGGYVELSNHNDPVSDPYSIESKLNFQPFPLLTMSAGYINEKGGREGAIFNASLTYHLGIPLAKQLDYNQVAASKSLDARLFDLVNRNHNIRLEYREKSEQISVGFRTKQVNVQENQRIAIADWLQVKGDKTLIKEINYSGSAAAYMVNNTFFQAPAYNTQGSNLYSLNARVTLSHGQVIAVPAPINITITQQSGAPELANSTLVINRPSIAADGQQTATLMLQLKDSAGNPLTGQQVSYQVYENGIALTDGFSLTPANETAIGEYHTDISGTRAGKYIVKARVAGAADFELSVSLIMTAVAGLPSVADSTLALSPVSIGANGIDTAIAKLTLLDGAGNKLVGQKVQFSAYQGNTEVSSGVALSAVTDSGNGDYSASFTSTLPGQYHVRAFVEGAASFTKASNVIDVIANPAPPVVNMSGFTVSPNVLVADGVSYTQATLLLRDGAGNPLSGKQVKFKAFAGSEEIISGINISSVQADGSGNYSAKLSATRTGQITLKATVSGHQEFEITSNPVVITAAIK